MQVDRQTLLFFMIMFIFLQLLGDNSQPQSSKDRETLDLFHNQLITAHEQLQNNTYTDGYGNITGFHLSYQDLLDGKNASDWPLHDYNKHPWKEQQEYSILPNEVSNKVKLFWGTDIADEKAYLLNISGSAYGEFDKDKINLTPYPFQLPTYLQEYYDSYTQGKYEDDKQRYEDDPENNDPPKMPERSDHNVTLDTGKVSIEFSNYDYNYKSLARFVNKSDEIHNSVIAHASITFKSYDESESYAFDTRGVYFQDTGSMVATTNSAKFMGIYGLNHLALKDNFNVSKILMDQVLKTTNVDRDINLDDVNQNILKAVDHCELITYIQFKKTAFSKKQLQQIDQELKHRTGLPLPDSLPQLEIDNFVIYSPDCGLVLEKKANVDLVGIKSEVLNKRLKYVLSGLLFIVGAQLFLYLRQIKVTRTPGQLSVISIKTLYLLGYQDALIALMFLLVSTFLDELYLLLATIAVTAFIMCGIFELRFMVAVLTTQVNERESSWWEILRGGTRVNEGAAEGGAENDTTGAGTPVEDTTNVAALTYTDEASYTNGIFAGGFTITILSTFLILNSLAWRTKYRVVLEYVGLLLINSYWVPQFFRNTLKNRRQSFTWEFIIFTSLFRVIPIAYFALVKSNPLRHHYDPYLVATVASWLYIQIFFLFLQSKLGPRFWVNEKWLPKAYDYQPILSLKDLESGYVSDLLEGIKLENESNGVIETPCTCPICMNEFALPVVVKDEGRKHVNSKGYMITPCHHIFHTECLENWMKYKLQCPVCRHSLPPI